MRNHVQPFQTQVPFSTVTFSHASSDAICSGMMPLPVPLRTLPSRVLYQQPPTTFFLLHVVNSLPSPTSRLSVTRSTSGPTLQGRNINAGRAGQLQSSKTYHVV